MAPVILEIVYLLGTIGCITFFLQYKKSEERALKGSILWWFFFGSLYNFVSFTWLYTVYPLIWMPEGMVQLFAIFLLHSILTFFSGCCFFIVGVVLFFKKKSVYVPLFVGIAFVLAEILRSIVLSLLYYSDKASIGLHYSAGTIGNSLAITPLVELAYLGGSYFLTFILTYNIATFVFIKKEKWLHFFLPLVVVYMVIHYGIPLRGPENPITVGIVTTDSKTVSDNKITELIKKTNESIFSMLYASEFSPDIIVLPEDTRFLSSHTEKELVTLSQKLNTPLFVDGATIIDKGEISNISVFFDSQKNEVVYSGKQFLLPFNEYIPYFFQIIFFAIVGDGYTTYKKNHTYTPLFSGKTYDYNGTKIATLICSEILSFSTVAKVKREDPDMVLFQSRLNVFNNNPLFIMHARSFSRIAGAQLRRPLIASNNYAPSFIINGRGKMVHTIKKGLFFSAVLVKNGEVILKER